MDPKIMMFACLVLFALIASSTAGKHKKVVIHVPYKVKNIKHTHTIYKTIHHHHGHGGGHGGHNHKSHHEESDEHEHFHHHGGGDLHGYHSAPVAQYVMPEMGHVPLPLYVYNHRR